MESFSPSLVVWSYGLTSLAFAIFALQLFHGWEGSVRGLLIVAAVVGSALWAASVSAFLISGHPLLWVCSHVFEVASEAIWLMFLASWVAHPEQVPSLRKLVQFRSPRATLMASLVALSAAAQIAGSISEGDALLVSRIGFGGGLCMGILGLVVLELFYRNSPEHYRWGIKPLIVGLGAVYAFDIYMFSDAFLFWRMDWEIWNVRGIVHALSIPFVAIAAARNRTWTFAISVSRRVVFHSTALLAVGIYLVAMAGAGYYLRFFGGGWGKALQTVFLFCAVLALVTFAGSGSMRAKLRVFVNKHFFSYRYDYREEWLRFTRALSSGSTNLRIAEFAIKALADLVESPSGAIWVRNQTGGYIFAARWNMREVHQTEQSDSSFVEFMQRTGWVIKLQEYVERRELYEGVQLPSWLSDLELAWLVIPLMNGDELIGFVVLTRPRAAIEVNWEVLDLLKTGGRQAASYLAQMQATEALLEARKFESFNKMSAFVVHDLKNLVAQLSLLLRNAERHKNNPEFQQDMLMTIENVTQRMKHLMVQLREGAQPIDAPRPIELGAVTESIRRAKVSQRPAVHVEVEDKLVVMAHADRLERVLGNLVQNALDATADEGKVSVSARRNGSSVRVEIRDDGHGMTEQYMRERLFKPFQSTKETGMGIGVYESQQYITEIGGSIAVDSTPGVGTCFTVSLPLIRQELSPAS
ncbi:MAG: PEP-CTERM system histidine kinase PrsK [Rhodocyclaceae bacterium]|nr:PEP-CTERM system histidine kinase PrsK [Rhodocyclaceae bacterium]MBX3667627.1 PEP-CTERM system histidine kinase PrsK [Rhodocyclaceae bacterium]